MTATFLSATDGHDAYSAVCAASIALGAKNDTLSTERRMKLEYEELMPYSQSFRIIVSIYPCGIKMVEIFANDDGCVNCGSKLAECFLDGSSFYYEA